MQEAENAVDSEVKEDQLESNDITSDSDDESVIVLEPSTSDNGKRFNTNNQTNKW